VRALARNHQVQVKRAMNCMRVKRLLVDNERLEQVTLSDQAQRTDSNLHKS
jgi:hypothetical protein